MQFERMTLSIHEAENETQLDYPPQMNPITSLTASLQEGNSVSWPQPVQMTQRVILATSPQI